MLDLLFSALRGMRKDETLRALSTKLRYVIVVPGTEYSVAINTFCLSGQADFWAVFK